MGPVVKNFRIGQNKVECTQLNALWSFSTIETIVVEIRVYK